MAYIINVRGQTMNYQKRPDTKEIITCILAQLSGKLTREELAEVISLRDWSVTEAPSEEDIAFLSNLREAFGDAIFTNPTSCIKFLRGQLRLSHIEAVRLYNYVKTEVVGHAGSQTPSR
jgi:hypothetical protein